VGKGVSTIFMWKHTIKKQVGFLSKNRNFTVVIIVNILRKFTEKRGLLTVVDKMKIAVFKLNCKK